MSYWTARFASGAFSDSCGCYWCYCSLESGLVAGRRPQPLEDLEDILNSPAPALDSPTGSNFQASRSQFAKCNQADGCLPSSSALQQNDPLPAHSSAVHSQPSAQLVDATPQLEFSVNTGGQQSPSKGRSVWATAYQRASAPVAAVLAQVPDQLHRLQWKVSASFYLQITQ